VDQLERAADLRQALQTEASARTAAERAAALHVQIEAGAAAREAVAIRRSQMVIPAAAALAPMRRLDSELAVARGALQVGLVVTISPQIPLELQLRRDGTSTSARVTSTPIDIEADSEVDLEIAGIASVRIRGGRREAHDVAAALEQRWRHEVMPHLTAAGVSDLEALTAAVAAADALDAELKSRDSALAALRAERAPLVDSASALREAAARVTACRDAMGGASLEPLAGELGGLGSDPVATLRRRRQQLLKELEAARAAAITSGSAAMLAAERARQGQSALAAAAAARDRALSGLSSGAAGTISAARLTLAAAAGEQRTIEAERLTLESTIANERARVDAALHRARTALERARAAVDVAQARRTSAIADHAAQAGRRDALQQQRDAEDLAVAGQRLLDATARHATLPVPARIVTEAEVATARSLSSRVRADLESVERDIQRAHGALGQVGGAVARERLRDAVEAFELAENNEREIEADYEAWLLLLEQMKQADLAQASNLGQTLAPAIAGRFEALTQQRYENIRLGAQLGTEGVVVGGTTRSTERISIGTRDQLSTLYRLAMAEYLDTTVVLDDQLVQSDETRMDWFRSLLVEKAQNFQIVVFTCRPGDYLGAGAMVGKGKGHHRDSAAGLVRAIDLHRAIRRH
jgi:hypothetical protein